MNIKSEEAYAIASELAGMAGETLTNVVLEALRAKHRKFEREKKIEELMEFCGETAAMMSPEQMAFDIDKELYDEVTGLPK